MTMIDAAISKAKDAHKETVRNNSSADSDALPRKKDEGTTTKEPNEANQTDDVDKKPAAKSDSSWADSASFSMEKEEGATVKKPNEANQNVDVDKKAAQ